MHKCTSYGPDKSGRAHAQRTHIHRTEVVTTMSRSPKVGSTQTTSILTRMFVFHSFESVSVLGARMKCCISWRTSIKSNRQNYICHGKLSTHRDEMSFMVSYLKNLASLNDPSSMCKNRQHLSIYPVSALGLKTGHPDFHVSESPTDELWQSSNGSLRLFSSCLNPCTVELQWLEHLCDHEN